MAIHSFSTGAVRKTRRHRGIRRYLVDDWAAEALPVHVFLVEQETGLLLFDTGQTARAAEPGYFPAWYPFFRLSRFELTPADEVVPQLAELGHEPADVRWVVLSHMHTDHVGVIEPFAGADVLVSRREWDDAQGWGGRLRGSLPQYWPRGLDVQVVDFDGPPVGPFHGTHDVAGDGSLILVPTPGHTRGHMALLVRDAGRTFLLGGDASMTAAELRETNPALAEFCEREGVVLLATHDPSVPELLAAAYGVV